MSSLRSYILGCITVALCQWAPIIAAEFVPPHILQFAQSVTAVEDHKAFFKHESLCFQSAESSYDLGTVTNCIRVLKKRSLQLWIMQQDIAPTGPQSSTKNLIAIAVDSTDHLRPSVYYLELNRDNFERWGGVDPVNYKVPCLMCHPSGPRVIRPTMKSLSNFTSRQRKTLQRWNDKLASIKIVNTYIPHGLASKYLFPKDPATNSKNVLKVNPCYECHNSKTGVRAELTYDQVATVAYLAFHSTKDFGHAAMPSYGSQPLDESSKAALMKWITGEEQSEAHLSSIQDETITATVKTNFHQFDVKGFKISDQSQRNPDGSLAIDFTLDLQFLKTGISARDEHLKTVIQSTKYPYARLTGSLPANFMENSVLLTLVWQNRQIQQRIKISRSGNSVRFSSVLKLEDWGIEPPTFLGIKVQPHIDINGVTMPRAL
jgi:polyisoprenoid-binding protein YceI